MSDRSHLSIGEVLTLVQRDFPDVTISKIRFLESQGLLDPERTPSGYRKFYEGDIERLRWILRQQRENFLPLKVIKDRLADGEVDFSEDLVSEVSSVGDAPVPDPTAAESTPDQVVATMSGTSVDGAIGTPGARPADPAAGHQPEPDTATDSAVGSRGSAGRRHDRGADRGAASLLQEAPTPRPTEIPAPEPESAAVPPATARPSAQLFDTGITAVSLTLDELIGASGLTAREVGDLERFGMLSGRSLGSTTYYDEDALLVARLAAGFRSHGVEARHLRMYKVSAEREAGVFEQLLMPMVRKRNAQSRRESAEMVNELVALGDGLRTAMLRQLLRDYIDGT